METRNKIKNRRIELGLTLEDVAKKVGVGRATVQRWESGLIENMRRDKIVLLAQALNTTPNFILGVESTENAKKDIKIPPTLKDTLVAAYSDTEWTQEKINEIDEYIKFKAERGKKKK